MDDAQLTIDPVLNEGQATAPGASPRSKPAPTRRRPSCRRVWLFRLLAVTVVPATALLVTEAALYLFGIGYPTRYLLKRERAREPVYVENLDFGKPFFPAGLERAPLPLVVRAD